MPVQYPAWGTPPPFSDSQVSSRNPNLATCSRNTKSGFCRWSLGPPPEPPGAGPLAERVQGRQVSLGDCSKTHYQTQFLYPDAPGPPWPPLAPRWPPLLDPYPLARPDPAPSGRSLAPPWPALCPSLAPLAFKSARVFFFLSFSSLFFLRRAWRAVALSPLLTLQTATF